MTEYQRPSFTVKTGGRRPEECEDMNAHWFTGKPAKCVFCGAYRIVPIPATPTEETPDDALTPEEKAQLRECWRFPLLPPDGA